MNAKQRRKLLREQQQREREQGANIQKDVETKNVTAAAVAVATSQDDREQCGQEGGGASTKKKVKLEDVPVPTKRHDNSKQLETKKQHQLKRSIKQKTDVVAEDEPTKVATTVTINDNQELNTEQRTLVKRPAKRKVEGKEKKKPSQKKQKKEQGEEGETHKSIHLTLFVGQLPYRATESMVRRHFAEAGDIKLRMLTDKVTKKFKGTAFIEVKDSKALGAALSRHHTLLQGRRINVEMTASGGGNKSENRRNKIDRLRKKQSHVQVEKTKALIQKHIDGREYKLKQEDVDDRMIDFLSWFDYETAKNALNEYNRCVGDRVNNRKAFFMGILKRFRQTDGEE